MGITLQRVIDQNRAALATMRALKEYMHRIQIQLAQHTSEDDPARLPLLILASIQVGDLFESLDEYDQTITSIARESENIRLTHARTLRRHLRRSPPSVPDLTEFSEESLIEKRGRLFRESFEQSSHDSLKDPFSSLEVAVDKPPQPLKEDKTKEEK